MTQSLAVHARWAAPANLFVRDLVSMRTRSLLQVVAEGFECTPKRLPASLLYDMRGAELFASITRTQEYYLSRIEASILAGRRADLAQIIDAGTTILEYGAGEMQKVRLLLAAALPNCYVAVDIARDQLVERGMELATEFPQLLVELVYADFSELTARQLALPEVGKRLFFHPGSTIGNLEPRDAEAFLRTAAGIVRADGCAIVGVDLRKDTKVLERAYNDSDGYTARFNLNVLARINRELGAEIALSQFEHVAFYNASAGRIEMHLRSRCAQSVTIGGRRFALSAGEMIHTENSYKYLPESFSAMANRAGFEQARMWTDDARQFGVFVLHGNTRH